MFQAISVAPQVGWRNIAGETAAFDCRSQTIALWNRTASELWQLLTPGSTPRQLAEWLVGTYELESLTAKQDVLSFLDAAANMGLIRGWDAPPADQEPGGAAEDEGVNVLLELEFRAIKHVIPFAVTFETTYACNEQCIHCYMDRHRPSLALGEIKQILDQVAAAGCLFVTFTGGEFFARPDALEIVEHAGRHHFVIDILSNGTLITDQVALRLSQLPVRRVQVSLYGASASTHDEITRLAGSFQQTVRAIKLLRQRGIKVEIAFPLMNANFDDRFAVRDLARSLGCFISPSHIITARNDGNVDTHGLRLADTQIRSFLEDKELSGLYAGRKAFEDHQYYLGLTDLSDAVPCYSGINSCAITPQGKVLPCNQLLLEVGDLRKRSFQEIWTGSTALAELRGLKIRDLSPCAECPSLRSCARCPGLALLEGGNLLGPSPEHCRIASIQAERG